MISPRNVQHPGGPSMASVSPVPSLCRLRSLILFGCGWCGNHTYNMGSICPPTKGMCTSYENRDLAACWESVKSESVSPVCCAHPRAESLCRMDGFPSLILVCHLWTPLLSGSLEARGSQPSGHSPFEGLHITHSAYQTFALQFITTAKLQLRNSNKNSFMVGITALWGTALKGHSLRKVEKHRS